MVFEDNIVYRLSDLEVSLITNFKLFCPWSSSLQLWKDWILFLFYFLEHYVLCQDKQSKQKGTKRQLSVAQAFQNQPNRSKKATTTIDSDIEISDDEEFEK